MRATCERCEKIYNTLPSWYNRSKHHYCSKPCSFEASKQRRVKQIKKLGMPYRFKPGHKPSINRKMPKGAKHYAWKGQSVSYRGLHYWLRRVKGIPSKCNNCGSHKSVQWASRDGLYPRDPNHYLPLCASCHKHQDLAIRDSSSATQ